ncbi:nicotinate-nucleotide adenylyltransferase [Paenibacillus wenxiniae]|uniref:Probable nicotinate-nucleotide adenylyltransferase n=1 Tax=Paenibacillus wenxiniae TaxID=1636843 RepID=A0ABW4RI80_9BACL
MKVGIMGGTFDPVHIGHMLAAEAALEGCALDEVWFMPSHIPPHKHAAGASGKQRLQMVERAIGTNPAFRTLDIELERGGVSYTIETIRALQERYGEHEFFFIIGADMVNSLTEWHGIEELAQRLTFVGVGRPGSVIDKTKMPAYLQPRVQLVNMPQVDISSTDIRERLQNGQTIRYMVHDHVYEYIKGSGIYEADTR